MAYADYVAFMNGADRGLKVNLRTRMRSRPGDPDGFRVFKSARAGEDHLRDDAGGDSGEQNVSAVAADPMIAARRTVQSTISSIIYFGITSLVVSQPLSALPRLISVDNIVTTIASLWRRAERPLTVDVIAVMLPIIPTSIVARVAPS